MPWILNLHPVTVDSLEPYVVGTVAEAWARCLPVWLNSSWNDETYAHGGRVNDFPPGLRRTGYLSSNETILGRLFVEQFAADYSFLLDRFAHGSFAEKICAYDLLVFLARDLYSVDEPLPHELGDCRLPLLPVIRAELERDYIYSDHLQSYTLGEVLSHVHNGV